MKWATDHVAFEVSDLDAAVDFYCGVLGLELMFREVDVAHGEAFAFFDLDSGKLELLQRLGADGKRNHTEPGPPWCPHLALRTDDLDAVAGMLRDRGVKVLKGPLEIAGKVRWLYAGDPDGNVIEFVEWA